MSKPVKILGGVVAAVALVVGVLAVIVALQPSEFRIERSATIAAPAPAVFAQVNDFHNWEAWSPWAKLDPAARNTFEGPRAGQGAAFAWAGNSQVGEGRMTITESRPSELVRIKLEFLKPFEATNTAEFTFKPQGERTVVTWSMYGDHNFVGRAVGLFVNMDKALGGEFEKGLASMKSVAEASAKN
ncbi:MAG: SRPBCC family protein [Candidatus Rokuibacteriota bacterium]